MKSNSSKINLIVKISAVAIVLAVFFAYRSWDLGGNNLLLKKEVTALKSMTVNKAKIFSDKETELGRRIMMERTIGDIKLVAFRLNDIYSETGNGGVFAIEAKTPEYQPVIFSVSSSAFSEDKVFEVVNKDQIWVVNGQTNTIEVYKLTPYKRVENVVTMAGLSYDKSIKLPRLAIGSLYGISCKAGICELRTAFHQESGCRLTLNISTVAFSKPSCSDINGEFVPKSY